MPASQTLPCFWSRPCVANFAVVGSVTPSASPTAASDGPDATKVASMPPKCSRSVAVPSTRICVLSACTSSHSGTATASVSDAASGNRPLERSCSTSGAWR